MQKYIWGIIGGICVAGAVVGSGIAESTDVFQSKSFAVEIGLNELIAEQPFNSMTLFTADGNPLPELSYETDQGGWQKVPLAHSHGVAIVDMTDMLTYDTPRTTVLVRSGDNAEIKAHFFFTPQSAPEYEESNSISSAEQSLRPQFISRNRWLRGIDSDESTTLDVWERTRQIEQNSSARVRAKLIQPEDDIYAQEPLDDESELFSIDGENQLPRITVHHTVTPHARIFDPYATVRSIYQYHTYTRGWGDIGYHYIVSPEGLIFEGSADGPTKSGTHVANRNFNNIGISLMGNFQGVDKPTDAQLEVLSLLIADHALRFDITPSELSTYFGKEVHRVAGHRDIASRQYGTACPGEDLHRMLPEIRDRSEQIMQVLQGEGATPITARDFLQQSSIAPKIQGRANAQQLGQKREMPITMFGAQDSPLLRRGVKGTIEVRVKNNTKTTWPADAQMLVEGAPEGMLMTHFYAAGNIEPGESGAFRAKYLVRTTSNGFYDLTITEDFLDQTEAFRDRQKPLNISVQISGDRDFLLTSERKNTPAASLMASSINPIMQVATEPEIKIKLAFFNERYADLVGSSEMDIYDGERHIATVPANESAKVIPLWDEESGTTYLNVVVGDTEIKAASVSAITRDPDGHVQIRNYDRGLGPSHSYNTFRQRINVHMSGRESILVVNQLPIRLYMRGISEEPTGTPIEKRKAIHVLAQSYAWVYSQTEKRKFGTDQYDLEDDPASSQYYLGYEWEKYHNEQIGILELTEGEVITVNDVPVIGPYYTCSGGASSDKWRSSYPHTKAQSLPDDYGCNAAGHGVGLSGYTTLKMAERGSDYEEILHFFYDGIDIEKVY